MINYNKYLSGEIQLEKQRDINEDMKQAYLITLDPLLVLVLISNVLTAYKMEKMGKYRYYWLIGSNLLNVYLFNLISVRNPINAL